MNCVIIPLVLKNNPSKSVYSNPCHTNTFFKSLLKTFAHYFLSNFYFSPNDSPSKIIKNVFYFI